MNCSKPFLLNHQCDNNYDVDEDDVTRMDEDEFGNQNDELDRNDD